MEDQSIMFILGFVVLMIGLVSPIIKLNATITKLNVTLETFQMQTEKNHNYLSERVTQHGKEIDNLKETAVRHSEAIKQIIKEGK